MNSHLTYPNPVPILATVRVVFTDNLAGWLSLEVRRVQTDGGIVRKPHHLLVWNDSGREWKAFEAIPDRYDVRLELTNREAQIRPGYPDPEADMHWIGTRFVLVDGACGDDA